jgi:hypothetical protein
MSELREIITKLDGTIKLAAKQQRDVQQSKIEIEQFALHVGFHVDWKAEKLVPIIPTKQP